MGSFILSQRVVKYQYIGKYIESIMPRGWSNGLFSCFGDCGSCLYVYFCPCCAAGAIYEGAEMGSCCIGCMLFCCLTECWPCITTGALRNKRGIEGSCLSDTCTFYCCTCCHMTRSLREVRGT